ncbi:hypothetical protein WAF17_10685 [Bernardetia sp. ABR2-2B]|uniref:hypothetical protein n=1 Tax=Bernardetia sp. ABR2-2B TaxID=3127472 RepID=UPI0030CE33A1
MTYLLIFLLVLCVFLLIKKSFQLRKEKSKFIQLELERWQVHLLFKDYVFNKNLQNEIATLEYFKKYGLGEENPESAKIYESFEKYLEQQEL